MCAADHQSSPPTRWSEVARAAGVDPRSREALDGLLRRYLPLLRLHLQNRWSLSETATDDLLQDFVANKVLEQRLLSQADPFKGKFRTFLLTALDRYAIDRHRRSSAMKRDESGHRPIDPSLADPGLAVDFRAFEFDYAREVVAHALSGTETYCREGGLSAAWEVFRIQIVLPMLTDTPRAPYAEIVGTLGFSSPAEASNALNSAKRIFRRRLRETLIEFGADPQDLDAELRELGVDLRRS